WCKEAQTNTQRSQWTGQSIALDANKDVFISGSNSNYGHKGTLTFGNVVLNVDTISAYFIIKCDNSGSPLCGNVLNIGKTIEEIPYMACNYRGNYVYLAGGVYNDTIFCGYDTLIANSDVPFCARWQPCASPPDTSTQPPQPTSTEPCSLFVPNAFSPNGDGQNDILYVRDNCILTMDFTIYDRWGNKVFESKNQSTGWDGAYL